MLGGDRLKFLRIYHNLTQKYMAECLGCSTRWIKGHRKMRGNTDREDVS